MNNIEPLTSWINQADLQKPIVIAGPCSAETPQQVMQTAVELKSRGINIFRAGIWKPRTRPNCFEGVGKKGLQWLQDAKKATSMMMATEVANAKHVELALEANIDILWIGARTSVNPFAIQEIADALRNVDIPIMVKNPINPDLSLWIGAFERLYNSGVKKLAAIHRGFSTYKKIKYRNEPQWQIAIELKRQFPNLPIFCDPSHICGNRHLIEEVAQTSMDLNYHGLIVESHINPHEAWSDAKQQLTPNDLVKMLNNLVIRKAEVENEELLNRLSYLRTTIDHIDNQILDLIEERMEVVNEIGKYKKVNNIAVFQNQRWNSMLNRIRKNGKLKGLSEELVSTIFKAIHLEAINRQTKIMKKHLD